MSILANHLDLWKNTSLWQCNQHFQHLQSQVQVGTCSVFLKLLWISYRSYHSDKFRVNSFWIADTSVISVISRTPSLPLQSSYRASSRPPRLRFSKPKFCNIHSSEGTLRLWCNRRRKRPPCSNLGQHKNSVIEEIVPSNFQTRISQNEQRCEARQYEWIQRSILSLHVSCKLNAFCATGESSS